MLSFAEEFAIEKRCKVLRLDVTVQNIPSMGLYEKYGFKYIGDIDLGYDIPGFEKFKCFEKSLNY